MYPHSIVNDISKSVCLLPRGRVPLIKAYTGRLHPKFRLQVYEKVLLVEAQKKGREIFHFSLEKGPKGLKFYGCEKVKKVFWCCDLFIF